MDSSWDDEATQQATQPLPPHNGISPSDSAGQDFSDVLCFLHPCTAGAIAIVQRAQHANSNLVFRLPVPRQPTADHGAEPGGPAPSSDAAARPAAQAADPSAPDIGGSASEDTAIDIALRYTPGPKEPLLGYLFGRNPFKCDIPLIEHPNSRRISNTHFRIYVNASGALMLEDLSTNGTWVDHCGLGLGSPNGRKRVLNQGCLVGLCPGADTELIQFIVRIPSQSGKGMQSADAPDDGCRCDGGDADGGKGRLFHTPTSPPPPPSPRHGLPHHPTGIVQSPQQKNLAAILRNPLLAARRGPAGLDPHTSRRPSSSMAWGGDDRYSLSTQIGKGAFATVHQAFERSTGEPAAVKIIAKRTFAAQAGKDLGVKKEANILQLLKHVSLLPFICKPC